MCNTCERAPADSHTVARRSRIWEVQTGCHCLICGTCFSITELRKIAAKAKVRIPANATDYQIHAHFVRCAAEPGPVAKLMQKTLDRKYRTAIEHCRRHTSESELRDFWDQSLAEGNIAGPFWALMTHPAITDALAVYLFGKVHMLSHLEGSSNRANLRQLHALMQEKKAIANTLSHQVAESRRRLAKRDREIKMLRRRVQEANAIEQRLKAAEAWLDRYEAGTELQALNARIEELERALVARDTEITATHTRLAERTAALEALNCEVDGLRRSLSQVEAECQSLASFLQDGAAGDADVGPACSFDLSGRSIVYVGGRTGLIAHFRDIVERANGRFIHHDGGIEENERRLGHLLAQGDVVLCPVDCVSHRACTRAKRFCKRTARTFVPLRSSGLSSFVDGLHQIAVQYHRADKPMLDAAE